MAPAAGGRLLREREAARGEGEGRALGGAIASARIEGREKQGSREKKRREKGRGKRADRREKSSAALDLAPEPLLEAANFLAGEARGGLLALEVGERGARTLNAALGVLDALEQGPVLFAA